VTWILIAVNMAIFVYQVLLAIDAGSQASVEFVTTLALRPSYLLAPTTWFRTELPAPVTLFTSMFVHAGLWHLLGNMLYLWVFGDNVEDRLGHFRYLVFYLACGLGAALTQVMLSLGSDTPMVGASGAIAGVLGAYLVLYPHARVLTLVFLVIFIRIMYLPAIILLGIWFALQMVSAMGGGGGVAWYAHIGGFVTGILLIAALAPSGRSGRGRPAARRRRHIVH
jgi:membrane associated rhomboid family serine protease